MMLSFIRRGGRGVAMERILCVRLVNFRRPLSFSRLVRIPLVGEKNLEPREKNADYFERESKSIGTIFQELNIIFKVYVCFIRSQGLRMNRHL